MPIANPTIDQSFIKQFESEVHLAYQRMGAKLLNTVRRKTNVKGESTTFQTVGKAVAGTKARHGQVPINNLDHTPVECTLSDFYSGEFIDQLDTLKIQHNEREVAATSVSAAMGRKSDENITTRLDTATNATAAAGGVTLPKIEEVYEHFGNNDIPDDGQRYLVVSPQGWTDLMNLDQFSNADYLPEAELPFKGGGFTMKRWFSFFVMMHSGLTINGSNERNSLAYHRTALGHASGQDVRLDVTWQGKEQSWLVVASLSEGTCLIDDLGVYKVVHTET